MPVWKLAFSRAQLSTILHLDQSRRNCEGTRGRTDEDRDASSSEAELVSRRCTLIRLLCTVIGCDIRPFTRLAEQMEANRERRSCTGVPSRVGASISDPTTSFSLANKRLPLDAKTQFRMIFNKTSIRRSVTVPSYVT